MVRYQRRRSGKPYIDPVDEERFRRGVITDSIVWAGFNLRVQAGVDAATLSRIMGDVAAKAEWWKMVDSAGIVRAIGMPLDHPRRRRRSATEFRSLMYQVVCAAAAVSRERLDRVLEAGSS